MSPCLKTDVPEALGHATRFMWACIGGLRAIYLGESDVSSLNLNRNSCYQHDQHVGSELLQSGRHRSLQRPTRLSQAGGQGFVHQTKCAAFAHLLPTCILNEVKLGASKSHPLERLGGMTPVNSLIPPRMTQSHAIGVRPSSTSYVSLAGFFACGYR